MLDTLKIARDLSEGDVFTHEQAERLANALATYWNEIRSELVTTEYLDARLSQFEAMFGAKLETLEARFETKLAQVQNRILASQVALFVLLGIAILLK
jgi:hypothetical protein